MRRRVTALSTVAALTTGLAVSSPARAAGEPAPVVDIGVSAGTRVNRTVDLQPRLDAFTGVTRVSLYANHTFAAQARTQPWSLHWNTTGINDQDVLVHLIIEHAGGSTRTAPLLVRVDNYAPLPYFPLEWGNSSQLQSSNSSFTGVVDFAFRPHNDAETVRKIELLVDGVVIDTTTAAPWQVTWDTTVRPEGFVRLVARAHDDLGNVTETTAWLFVDRTGPTTTVEFPMIDGYVSVNTPIGIRATDPALADRAELYLNGVLAGTDTTMANGAVRHTIALPAGTPNGPATMTVKVYDSLGNVTEQTRPVLVDNDRAVATGTPTATYLRGAFPAGLTGFRDASGPAQLSVDLDGRTQGFTDQGPWSVRVDARYVPDGAHTLTWRIIDKARNLTTLRRTVHIDNTVPSVTYTKAPKNRARLGGKVTIKAGASDRYGVSRVQLLVNGKVVGTDSTAGYAFTLNPKKYGRTFTVQVRAYDRAGNVKHTAKRTYRR